MVGGGASTLGAGLVPSTQGPQGAGSLEASARWEAVPTEALIRRRMGEVGLAWGIGYLDLGLAGEWRSRQPALAAWLDDFAGGVPAFEATRFKG